MIIARAYAQLDRDRPHSYTGRGVAPHAIPWTAMAYWCAWHGFDRDAAERVILVVGHIDRVMLTRAINRMKSRR